MAAATSVHVVAIVEPIIQHADWFFPEGELWLYCSSVLVLLTVTILPRVNVARLRDAVSGCHLGPHAHATRRLLTFYVGKSSPL